LLRDGARADAVVTECEGANLTHGGWSALQLVVEVKFPDGSRAELREKVDVADIGVLRGRVGAVLPVRYDPHDRSAMALDVPAIRAEVEEATRRRDREAVARGRRLLEGGSDAPPENGPRASLAGLREQLAELTELRRALDAGQIGPDEYQRRRRLIAPTDEPG
jgi:hypothetical protein